MDSEGTVADALPEDFEGRDTIARFKTTEDLAKSFIETKRMVGNMATIPGEDATPEDRAKFFQKLGAPESTDGYESIEGVLDIREQALRAGVTVEQYNAIVAPLKERVAERAAEKASEPSKAEVLAELKEALGSKAEDLIGQSERFIEHVAKANPGLGEKINSLGLAQDPDVVQLLAEAYTHVGSDHTPHSANASGGMGGTSIIGAATRLAEIRGSDEYKSLPPTDPRYAAYRGEIMQLTKFLVQKGYEGVGDPKLKKLVSESIVPGA